MSQIKSGIRGQIDWPNIEGDGWSCRFQIAVAGVPVPNFTGYTFVGQVRRYSSSTSELLANITFDLTEGDGWVTMTATPVTSITDGDYYYDVKWTPPGGALKTLFGGKFPVTNSVTVVVP